MKSARPPVSQESSAPNSAKSTARIQLTPRQRRLLDALCTAPRLFREEVDRITGASNGPQVVAELRHTWLVDIHMERVDRTDRDGKPCKPGVYSITERGRMRALELGEGSHG